MIRKRPHNKSRSGCSRCKARKIKCDERKPVCSHCERYSAECVYLGATKASPRQAKPLPSVSDAGSDLELEPAWYSITDMALMHHWTVAAYSGFGEGPADAKGYQFDIPPLAFQYPFLLRAVLAVSALHMARTHPERRRALLQRAAYHQQLALPSYREIIEDVHNKLNAQNCVAVLAFASLATAHSLSDTIPSDDSLRTEHHALGVGVEWLHMIRGCRKIFDLAKPWLAGSPMGFHLRVGVHDVDFSANPDDAQLAALKSLFDRQQKFALTAEKQEEFQVLQISLERLRESSAVVFIPERGMGPKLAIYQWAGRVPERFLEMLGERKPEALVLMAHICVLLQRASYKGFWYIDGAPEHIVASVGELLGPEWQPWIAWPLGKVSSMIPFAHRNSG